MIATPPVVCVNCHQPLLPEAAYCSACGQRQPGAGWQSELRLVTILFADLVGFTNASQDARPEEVIDMLNQVFTRLVVECDREDGYLDKTVGDQLMVLFGAPRAHEDDPVRAVRAALNMQAAMAELAPGMREKKWAVSKLHIGINTGQVVWGEVGPTGRSAPTVIGDAVNLACRLQQLSEGGQILVSEAVYLHTRHYFEYEFLKHVQVKGKPEEIPVWVPLRVRQRASLSRRFSDTKVPLLEREKEMTLLEAHWSRALAGDPQAILLTGAAGLGKTRLMSEFSGSLDGSSSDKQPLMLRTWCESGESGNYQPLVHLLRLLFALTSEDSDASRRQKVDDRAQVLGIGRRDFIQQMGHLLGWHDHEPRHGGNGHDGDLDLERAVETAVDLFLRQARHRPTLITIDDLQWVQAASPSLEWIKHLCDAMQRPDRKHHDHRLMVLLASRPVGGVAADALSITHRMSLAPLGEVGQQDLVEYLLPGLDAPPSLIERLGHESGGNPFYLIEVVRCLQRSGQVKLAGDHWQLTRPVGKIDVPASVEGLVMATLDSLPSAAMRSVLQRAAVIGTTFSQDLLAALTAADDLGSILADLEQRGLLVSSEDDAGNRSYSFAERIVREVIYRSILEKTSKPLHLQIASLTEAKVNHAASAPRLEQDMESLAYHYTSGGQGDKTITYNLLVGRGSLARFEFAQAYHHLKIA